MQIKEYHEKVARLKEYIYEVKEKAIYLKDESNEKKLEELEQYINDESFNLVVVGEFSRGKSAFVNAIIGRNLLPSSKNPTTATLNVIEQGDAQPVFNIHYYNEKTKQLNEEEFKKIVAPELVSNKCNDQFEYAKKVKEIQEIKHIQVSVDNQLGRNGVTIIDTPGVNDLDTRREQITYNYIPKADAAIIILSATQQLTKSESIFIKERILKNDISKLFVAINFKDLVVSKEEQERVISYVRDILKDVVPGERIFLVSAKQALTYKRKCNGENVKATFMPKTFEETGFMELERELYHFLASERGEIKLERFRAVLNSIIQNMLSNTIASHEQAAHMTIDEIEGKIKQLKPQIHKKEKECTRELESLQRALQMKRDTLESEYRKLLKSAAYKAKRAVESYMGTEAEELFEIINEDTAAIEKEIQVDFPKRIQNVMMDEVKESLNRIGDDFAEIGIQLNGFGVSCKRESTLSFDDIERMKNEEKKKEDDEAAAVLLGIAGVGIAAVALLGAAVIPAAYIGVKLLCACADSDKEDEEETQRRIEENRISAANTSIRKIFMSEINCKYFALIEDRVRDFRLNYEKQVTNLIGQIQSECCVRLEQSVKLLEAELDEKKQESKSVEEELKNIENMKRNLEGILKFS